MKGGFTFCGVDIADIGLEYAPDNKDAYVYAPATSNMYEQTFEGHDGGYYFGSSKQPKEFHLRCFYEDKHVLKGVMARAFSLFTVGNSGKLVFKTRPWCYYYATVTETNIEDMYNYMNGIFTITMKAYYPYARGLPVNDHLFYNLLTDEYHSEIIENTALFDNAYMMPHTSFTFPNLVDEYKSVRIDTSKQYKVFLKDPSFVASNPTTFTATLQYLDTNYSVLSSKAYTSEQGQVNVVLPSPDFAYPSGLVRVRIRVGDSIICNVHEHLTSFVLYNPGTERAKVDIVIAGEAGDGITIANRQTQQHCKYIVFTSDDGDICTDGINGKTIAVKNNTQKLAFLCHDHGFIELEPAFPIIRNLRITCTGSTVTTSSMLYKNEEEKEWYAGKYIYIGDDNTGYWKTILRCEDKHTLSLYSAARNYTGLTCVVPMNQIVITPSLNSNISKLSFNYKPTFA